MDGSSCENTAGKAPERDQMDFVEVIELKGDGLIQKHCFYG
jgi:hypothetical protein